ncbi:hypothetical protein KDL45_03070 [bacterium]|nr:hypothetical protein [bacterium]
MHRVARIFTALTLTLSLVFGSVACEQEKESKELTVDEAVLKGKRALSSGDGIDANRYFKYAREKDGEDEAAAFGVMLAQIMGMFNFLDDLSAFDGLFAVDPDDIEPEPGPNTGDAIDNVLEGSALLAFGEAEDAYRLLAPAREVEFPLKSYELEIDGLTVLDLGGEFDKSDVYVFGALVALFNGVFHITDSHSLDFNLGNLVIPPIDFQDDPLGTLAGLSETLRIILSDPYYPNFLLMEDDGAESMQRAGIELGNTFDRLYQFFNQLTLERDGQANDQFRYIDVNGNQRYDADEEPVVLFGQTLQAQEAMAFKAVCGKLRNALWEGSSADENPQVDTIDTTTINQLLILLGVADEPLLPDLPFGLNIGQYFSDPTPTGLRGLVEALADVLDDIADAAAEAA